MNTAISEYLTNVSETHKVNILYAAESGSRAWGFASDNSDYDVRFIYARPVAHYLSFNVEMKSNVLELKTENPLWDISGWDIRKALELIYALQRHAIGMATQSSALHRPAPRNRDTPYTCQRPLQPDGIVLSLLPHGQKQCP